MTETVKPTLHPLTAHELQSSTASKVRQHIETRLHTLRIKNEADLDVTATAKVRGEIKALKNLKNLLALVKKDPTMVADDEPGE